MINGEIRLDKVATDATGIVQIADLPFTCLSTNDGNAPVNIGPWYILIQILLISQV